MGETLNAWGLPAKEMYWGGHNLHPNPASDPADCGLEIVADIEYSDACYQFDTRIVWKHLESGRYYTARDAGCSCPTPFEDYKQLSDLEDFDFWALKREVDEHRNGDDYYKSYPSADEARDFLNKIRPLSQPHAART